MNKTNKLLMGVLVLQSLLLAGQWTGSGMVQPAHAQIPDAGADRRATIDELRNVTAAVKSLEAKVDRLTSTLEGGKLSVRIAK